MSSLRVVLIKALPAYSFTVRSGFFVLGPVLTPSQGGSNFFILALITLTTGDSERHCTPSMHRADQCPQPTMRGT